MMYNVKMILTDNSTELYKYSKVINSGSRKDTDTRKGNGGDRNRRSTLHKAKTKILRIVNSNEWTMMLTLTYADDVTIEQSKKDICRFIKQLRQVYPQFIYLYVVELTKRGRPHFHMLVDWTENMDDMKEYSRHLAKIWGHGFIYCKEVTHKRGASHYLSKYFTKEPIDTSCKLYGYSRTCNKPIEIKCLDTREPIEILKEMNKNVVYSSSYQIDYNKNQVSYFVLEDSNNEN